MIKPGLAFVKAEALGNDFIIIDGRHEPVPVTGADAITLCDRRTGVGGDGVLLLEKVDGADFGMRVLNADGSEAEMCGNGIRCAVKYVYDQGPEKHGLLHVWTLAGLKVVEIIESVEGRASILRVNIGIPEFRTEEVAVTANGADYTITVLSVGNPHAVIFVDDASRAPVAEAGPKIEKHDLFPDRTNVEFVEVIGPDQLKMRVWERGSGETRACGTGAAASLAAAVKTGRSERRAIVSLAGGDLLVEWTEAGVFIEGGANLVYRGIWEEE